MEQIPKFYMDPEAARKRRKLLKSEFDDVFVMSQGTTRDAISYYVLNVHGKKVNFRARWSGTVGDDGRVSVRHVLVSIGWPSLDGGSGDQIPRSEFVKYVDYCVAALRACGGNLYDESSWGTQAEVVIAPELAAQLGEGGQ